MDWVTKLKAGDTGVMGEALELVLPPRFSLDEDHLQSDPNEFDIGYQILGPDRIALLIVLPQEMTVLPEKELRLKADGQAVAETRISSAKQREAVRYVIAGMVLAVTRLAFGVLPTIERLDVEVQGVTVDKSTGRFRDDPFVTASITRGAAQSLLYDTVDAVAAVTRLASASKDPDDQKILAPLVDRSGLLWAVTDDEVPPQPVGFLFRRGIGDDGRRDASQTAEQIKAMFSDVELVELAGESRPPIRPATAGGRDLILVDGGPRKIEVIKTIRGLLNLGLKEATDMVEAVPQVVRSGIEHEDAILLAGRLTKVGARVEIR